MDFTVDSSSKLRRSFSDGRTNRSEYHHFVFFSDDSLEPGDHTLTVTILDVTGNISAIIDYLTYKPTFDTIADKPNYGFDSILGPRSTDTHGHKGLIIGSVTGGLLFLLFLLLLGLRLIRMKRRDNVQPITSIRIFRMSESLGELISRQSESLVNLSFHIRCCFDNS